jgi:hypothetical protein
MSIFNWKSSGYSDNFFKSKLEEFKARIPHSENHGILIEACFKKTIHLKLCVSTQYFGKKQENRYLLYGRVCTNIPYTLFSQKARHALESFQGGKLRLSPAFSPNLRNDTKVYAYKYIQNLSELNEKIEQFEKELQECKKQFSRYIQLLKFGNYPKISSYPKKKHKRLLIQLRKSTMKKLKAFITVSGQAKK